MKVLGVELHRPSESAIILVMVIGLAVGYTTHATWPDQNLGSAIVGACMGALAASMGVNVMRSMAHTVVFFGICLSGVLAYQVARIAYLTFFF